MNSKIDNFFSFCVVRGDGCWCIHYWLGGIHTLPLFNIHVMCIRAHIKWNDGNMARMFVEQKKMKWNSDRSDKVHMPLIIHNDSHENFIIIVIVVRYIYVYVSICRHNNVMLCACNAPRVQLYRLYIVYVSESMSIK